MLESEIIKLAQKGDPDALSIIFNKYKKLITLKISKYFILGADYDDLVQEGMIGFLRALKAYDESKEASFNTFASICIKRHLVGVIKAINSNKHKIFNETIGSNYNENEEYVTYENRSFKFHSPEDICLGKEKIDFLIKNLKTSLSDMEKEVFVYMVKGYSYTEISIRTGRNAKTIDNTIQRVKRKINSAFKKY